MDKDKDQTKKDILNRLKRIEGQVKGIEKMIDGDSNCKDILVQVAAVRSAITKVGGIVLENSAKNCFVYSETEQYNDKKVEELVSTLMMFMK